MDKKIKTPAEYKEKFDNLLANNAKIYNKKGDKFIELNDKQTWTQAYADDDFIRCLFPAYWFVCKETAEVISVCRNTPRWLAGAPEKRNNRAKYMIPYTDDNTGKRRSKGIEAHNLNGLVHGSVMTDAARDEIRKRGLWAFGKKKGDVQGHHKDADINNNDASNIQFVIKGGSHDVLTWQPTTNVESKNIRYMQRISKVTEQEMPQDKMTVITTGDDRGIYAADGLYLSERASNELNLIIAGVREALGYEQGQ